MQVGLFASGKLTLRRETSTCAPAELHFSSGSHCEVTLSEGRYHQVQPLLFLHSSQQALCPVHQEHIFCMQVRRMFAACGAHVQALQRVSIGSLELDALDLREGEWMHLPLDTFDAA